MYTHPSRFTINADNSADLHLSADDAAALAHLIVERFPGQPRRTDPHQHALTLLADLRAAFTPAYIDDFWDAQGRHWRHVTAESYTLADSDHFDRANAPTLTMPQVSTMYGPLTTAPPKQ